MSDRRITPPYPERMMNMKRTLKILLCAALTAAICIPVLADVPATSSGLGRDQRDSLRHRAQR